MSKENCYEVYVCRVDREMVYIGSSSRMKKLFIECLDSDDWWIANILGQKEATYQLR